MRLASVVSSSIGVWWETSDLFGTMYSKILLLSEVFPCQSFGDGFVVSWEDTFTLDWSEFICFRRFWINDSWVFNCFCKESIHLLHFGQHFVCFLLIFGDFLKWEDKRSLYLIFWFWIKWFFVKFIATILMCFSFSKF